MTLAPMMTLQQSSDSLTLANLIVIKIKEGACRAEITDVILSTNSHKCHLCGVDASHLFFKSVSHEWMVNDKRENE